MSTIEPLKIFSISHLLSFWLMVLATNSAQAEALNVAFGVSRPPFVFNSQQLSKQYEEYQGQGLEVDIFTQALALRNHHIHSAIFIPNARLAVAISSMKLDAAVTVDAAEDVSFYSDYFIEYQNFAISRTADQLKIDSIADLTKFKTLAWQGARSHLGPEFKRLFHLDGKSTQQQTYTEIVDQKTQSVIFWHRHADVILVDKSIFLWNKKLLSSRYNTHVDVTYHNLFPEAKRYRVAFKSAALRDDFNLGLKHLRETGGYQKIVDQYIK